MSIPTSIPDPPTPANVSAAASLMGRVGANTKWANTPDRSAATAPARAAFLARFEAQVDPDNKLAPDMRRTMAANARKAHFLKLAARSAEVRRGRKAGGSR